MAISTASKYEFDIVATATTLKIPPNVLKIIIQKLFNMQGWRLIPDTVSFVEVAKAFTGTAAPVGPVLINGEGTLTIGVRQGQGTNKATTQAYICKAAKTVFDLSPWVATMDASLK
ncbi:virion structural protein [Pseudomonas phage 201phi2-1]|uniref:Virion structural protein n=1 Tax=Pseudomonas phage 201phi2-1 TaxID=198110 RepID=B3FK24_BP201|nr:virion structural protein [Pseudomonas phage 201phi2-1]ABY62882.1 virion structural protein [Pseudomonas phage 201phi2-1]